MVNTLFELLILCAVVAVLIWLISQIPFGPIVLKQILIFIVVLLAIVQILPMMGVPLLR